MVVLFFLSTTGKYCDRVKLLHEVSRRIGGVILLVGTLNGAIGVPTDDRFQVVEVGFRRGWRPHNILKASAVAASLVRDHRVAIVHDTTQALLPLFWTKNKFPDVTFVASLWALYGYRIRHMWRQVSPVQKVQYSRWRDYIGAWFEKQICMAADHVVLQAPGLIEWLLEYVPIANPKMHVLTNNVDTKFWRLAPEPRSCLYTHEPIRLLFAGSLEATRGVFHLIEMMRLLDQGPRPVVLTLVGNWHHSDRDEAICRIERYGLQDVIRIFPRMGREQLRTMFWEHNIFVYPSCNEGSPRVLLEAMACGLPIIASRHPGIDILDPAQQFIAFTKIDDVNRTVKWVRYFQETPTELVRRSSMGHATAEKQFSISAVADQYQSLYESMCSSGGNSQARIGY